jgi:hypothetical protein
VSEERRCVMCKKLLTGAKGETMISFPGKGKSFGCCSAKCFQKLGQFIRCVEECLRW